MNGGVGFMKKATGVIAAAVAVLTVMPASEVQAQTSNTIFPDNWDRSVRSRMFMRIGPISANIKTAAGDAVDDTAPVFSRAAITAARNWVSIPANAATVPDLVGASTSGITRAEWGTIFNALLDTVPEFTQGNGLGTPPGVKSKIGDSSTVALSFGYWLSDYWALEAFLIAKPLEVKAYAAGNNVRGVPLSISGQHILTSKLLPPLAILSRHFGSPQNTVRPFVGLGAMYAVMYGAKTTNVYDTYVGGKTSVDVKNAFGVGPFVGLSSKLNDTWSVNVQVGQIKLKTEARLTTRNTLITSQSTVVKDFSAQFYNPHPTDPFLDEGAYLIGQAQNEEIAMLMSRLVAASQGKSDLGSFTRKQEQKLRNTILNVSIGYSF